MSPARALWQRVPEPVVDIVVVAVAAVDVLLVEMGEFTPTTVGLAAVGCGALVSGAGSRSASSC